ncbi:YihY/virulence factor BrkB family protein [Marivita sp. S6314]|uniref:YihY/virulence factor BrkB family protein n=1 Tax=Marivita sp. S6314 TaxID=2926406 RepID=UPI001FF5F7E3|nr:YihY/virulence factor BrkB family protein [Marivita sp. S6314]
MFEHITRRLQTGPVGLAWRVISKQASLNLALIAAGIAFYALLSLFPAITSAVALAGFFLQPEMLVNNSEDIAGMLPDAAAEIVIGQLRAVAETDNSALSFAAILALIVAVYSASRAVANFIVGLNVIYAREETRGFFVVKALTILLTLVIIVGLLLAISIVAALPVIASVFGSIGWLGDLVLYLRWPILFLMAATGIAILYRYGPDRKQVSGPWLTPGALIACGSWVAVSYGFSVYVQSFASYNETFGALGGVIVLLTWLWLSAFAVLFGALIDAERGPIDAHTP